MELFFTLAGNPQVHDDAHAGSRNITPENMFNSPDGLSFDTQGRLWIRTDGKDTDSGDYEGQGNNQMLVGDPMSGEIQRFMVGPGNAKSPASLGVPIKGRSSSAFSIRALRVGAISQMAATRRRDRQSSLSRAMMVRSSASDDQ